MKIVQEKFPETQYYKVANDKKIIVLHHTVSGVGVAGDINWWKQTPEKVGTPFIIARDGVITQIFDEKYWIHHLGIKATQLKQFGSTLSNDRLNQLSIGIEIDSWGGLVKRNGKWYNGVGGEIPACDVQEYPKGYRGYYGFEKYTALQLIALKELLKLLCNKWKIKKDYFPEMFDFNAKAIKGYHGIWSHTSYRPDKSDVHPQNELIQLLKNL